MDLNKKTDVENEGGNEPLKTNPGDDINVNLGKFGNEVPNEQPNLVTPNPTLAAQAMEDTDQKKERKFKIDFERFNRRKQVSSNNSLSLKMDSWLRNKKSFIIVWLIILAIVITVLITQIVLPIFVNKAIHHGGNGAWLLPYNKNTAKASMILSYLALGFVPLPFLFLLTTWIIGINGVARSRTFHYVLWFLLSLSILCMIISIGCGGYVLNDCNSWISS